MATQIDKVYSLNIGVQGENIARAIELDMTAWVEAYPDATFHVLFKPYNESEALPMVSSFEDNILTWTPTLSATAVSGVGYTEIRAIDPDTGLIRKSRIIPTSVENSVSGTEADPPAPYQDWVNRILKAGVDAVSGAAAVAAVAQGEAVAFEINEGGHLVIAYTEGGEQRKTDLGPVDAYAIAVVEGYTGTREEWVQALADAEVNGLKAEGYAVGKQNDVAVESGEYYQNNAKYYNEQAQSAKEDAETAQTAAETAKIAAETAQAAAEAAASRDVATWLDEHYPTRVEALVDNTLTTENAAAEAKATGAAISDLKSEMEDKTERIDQLFHDGFFQSNDFIQGNRNNSGEIISHTGRCTTKHLYALKKNDVISIKQIDNGLKAVIAGINNGTNIYDSGWKQEDYSYCVVNEGLYYVIIVKNDYSALDPSSIQTLKIEIQNVPKLKKIDELQTVINRALNFGFTPEVSLNLFDAETVINGYRENFDAVVVEAPGYCYKRIAVEPSTKYTVSHLGVSSGNVFIYQLGNNGATGYQPSYNLEHGQDQLTFTTGENVYYISLNVEVAVKAITKFEKGESATPWTPYYNYYRNNEIEDIINGDYSRTRINGLTKTYKGKNLFDIGNVYTGKRWSGTSLVDNDSYNSILIPVEQNTDYVLSNHNGNTGNLFVTGRNIDNEVVFNANRTYPNTFVSFNSLSSVLLYLSYDKNMTGMQLEIGSSATEYEEYIEYETLHENFKVLQAEQNRKAISEINRKLLNIQEREYYADIRYISQEDELIHKVQQAVNGNTITFTLITDVHGTDKQNSYTPTEGYVFNTNYGNKNYRKHAEVAKKIAEHTNSDFIINLGDTINSTSDEAFLDTNHSVYEVNHTEIKKRFSEFTRYITGYVPYLYANAHHELFPLTNENHMSKYEVRGISQRFNRYLPTVLNEESQEPSYYYVDIPHKNIRVIVLDSVCDAVETVGRSYSEEEINWIGSVALNTTKKIVIFSHIATRENLMGHAVYSGGEELANVLNNFVDRGGVILGFWHGHVHFDNIVSPSLSGDRFPYIATEKAWPITHTGDYSNIVGNPITYARSYDQYIEYCIDVNVVHIDTGWIQIFRYGAGTDRSYIPE